MNMEINSGIFEYVNNVCSAFTEKTRIGVSERARALLAFLFEAVEREPDVRWSERDMQKQYYISLFPLGLQRMGAQISVRRTEEIRIFDVIHWLNRNTALTCGPIGKEGGG